MSEGHVVKILKLLQHGTEAEKETIKKLYPDIYRVFTRSIHDDAKIALRYMTELNFHEGKPSLEAMIHTPFDFYGKSYVFLTTLKERKG